ncbi:transglycosylase domain-containing protein [Nocardiopsis sp. LOL_012]|uniref:transglycosylase domain-containing protein n=1 Tax=Nocardiopsis sp. LOL_012 TaxID=3345409 RepID=UPI003A83D49C
MIIGGVAAFAILYAMAPDPNELDDRAEQQASASQILWEGGDVAMTTGEVQRIEVTREEIPQSVVNGVLAAEQRTFYEDPGINIVGIGRAVLSGGQSGGGSTITQQMARNYYGDLNNENRYIRKVQEIFISIKLGQQMEHDEILTRYLNTIYFGRGASGIEMASQRYFDKSVGELNDAEGAFLGMIIQLPSTFENPTENDEWTQNYLVERWTYMQDQLALMHEETDGERGLPEAEAEALEIPERIPYQIGEEAESDPSIPYIHQAIMDEIADRYNDSDITAGDIATQGYRIQTSLNPDLMDAAAEAFAALPEGPPEDLMRGLTAVRPGTGEIVAFYGGANYTEETNHSLTHRTQAGSSYKPYVLATALSQGIGLRTTLDGSNAREFPGLASPVNNAGNGDYGEVNLIEATANSYNTPYVDLATRVGEVAVDDMAVRLGVGPEQIETSARGPLIALGTHLVSSLDQATAYSTFANQGVHMPAHMIVELTDAEGDVVPPDDAGELETGTEVISPDIAADVTYALTQVVENGGGSSAALPDRRVAGKTGTSSNAVSAWFVGYTPQLTTAVGISRSSGEPLAFDTLGNASVFGGSTSALVWKEFMTRAMEGQEVLDFPPPAYTGEDQKFYSPSPSESPSESPSADDCEGDQRPGNGNGNDRDCPDDEETPECEMPQDWNNPDCEGEFGQEVCDEYGWVEWCQDGDPSEQPTDEDCGGLFQPQCPDPTTDPTDPTTSPSDGTGQPGRPQNNASVVLLRED